MGAPPERHSRAARRNDATVDTPGGDCQDERLAKGGPGQRNVISVRPDGLRPARAGVAVSAKSRACHRQVCSGEGRIEKALDLVLESASHSLVVRVNADRATGDVALHEESEACAGWRVEDPPVTDAGQLGASGASSRRMKEFSPVRRT
jgi:hypothetical protein